MEEILVIKQSVYHWGDNYWANFIVTYDGGQSADGITAYQMGRTD